MKLAKLFLFSILIGPTAFAASLVVSKPLDFNLRNGLPSPQTIFFGYSQSFFTWQEWLNRPSSGPLLVPIEEPISTLEVFEARSARVVKRPIGFFTRSYLQQLSTIQKLDSKNKHREIVAARVFTVETLVPFPPSWSEIILAAKRSGFLSEKSNDKLIIQSEFTYANVGQSGVDVKRDRFISLLNLYTAQPDIVSIQGLVRFNQLAKFGSLVSFFYRLDDQRTLVVMYFAIGIKAKDLNKGFNNMNVRNIMLGESPIFNSDDGIGAGLPKYVRNLMSSMTDIWDLDTNSSR